MIQEIIILSLQEKASLEKCVSGDEVVPLNFEPPGKVLGEQLSNPTLKLKEQIEIICEKSVRFYVLDETHYAKGGIIDGIPNVFLNLSKVTGFVDLIVNHELQHIVIDMTDYPCLAYSNNSDNGIKEIAALVRSVIEHPIIQQRQVKIGISDEYFQNMQVRKALYVMPPTDTPTFKLVESALRYVEFQLLCKNSYLLILLDEIYDRYAPNAKSLGFKLLSKYCALDGFGGSANNIGMILERWADILKSYEIVLTLIKRRGLCEFEI